MSKNHKNPSVILSEVESEYGLPPGHLRGKDRQNHTRNARRDAVKRLRKLGLSWHDIGHRLNRDHTTIIAINRGPRKRK